MEETVVMLPSPVIGHLISLVELAKAIHSRRPTIFIHILLPPAPYSAGSTTDYISAVSASTTSIKFHHMPTKVVPPNPPPAHKETLVFRILRQSIPLLHQSLKEISTSHLISAFIIDFFCSCSLEVASQLAIPTYFYFTSPAGCLACFANLSTLHRSNTRSFRDLNKALVDIPGIPRIPATDLPMPVQDREDEAYSYFLEFSETIPKAAGILVNSFEALEEEAVRAIRSGRCNPDHRPPTLYCTGPLLASEENRKQKQDVECLDWLDLQPPSSVLFLSFGSLGVFSNEQMVEIAIGLERSEQRFLWVVRNPPEEEEKEVEALLPEGFKERTKDRGLLVKKWAPQVAILNHAAVGGFVSHCGWNSILEAVCAGVPVVAWPLYAEQRLNRALIVQVSKIAIPMEEDDDGFVPWKEVEKRAREIMGANAGEQLRRNCHAMKTASLAAMMHGGSSAADLDRFLRSLTQKQ